MKLLIRLYKYVVLHNAENEVMIYVAILLLTGYMTTKTVRAFWGIKSDTYNDTVEIKNYTFGKVRKYFEVFSKKFVFDLGKTASSHFTIDGTMVRYFGK